VYGNIMPNSVRNVLALALFVASYARATLTNGTFETGNLTGWTSSVSLEPGTTTYCNNQFAASSTNVGSCGSLAAPIYGVYDAFASSSVPNNSNPASVWDELTQSFTVTPGFSGAKLTFASTASCTSATEGCSVLAELYLGSCTTCFAQSLTPLATFTILGEFPETVGWTSYSENITSVLQAHPGATFTLDFVVSSFSDQTAQPTVQSAAFDDVDIETSPEPATFVLLAAGLGGVALLRRGKKIR
jgi:hypothetical protein